MTRALLITAAFLGAATVAACHRGPQIVDLPPGSLARVEAAASKAEAAASSAEAAARAAASAAARAEAAADKATRGFQQRLYK